MEESSGERKALIQTLIRLGRMKFGEPDSATLALVERSTDADRLQALTDRLLDVTNWQDLLS